MEFRKKVPDKPGSKTRQDKHRKDLGHDHAECRPEIDFSNRVHKRDNQGHQNSGQEVDENDIGSDARNIAAKFAGNDGRCSSCRTYEAEHGAFYKNHPVPSIDRKC